MFRKIPYTVAIASCLLLGFGLAPAQAQLPEAPTLPHQLQAKDTPTPTVRRRSGRRKPASSRGPCSPGDETLTALTPETNIGLTTKAHPTFFVYMPQTPVTSAAFVLIDEENQRQIYATTFAVPESSGIVSISLPDGVPPLTVGKDYHWYVSLICDPQDRAGDIYVDGWVRRIAPESALINRLQKASPLTRVTLYREQGIWYDALEVLAEAYRLSPDRAALVTKWQSLLRSVGLNDVAQEGLYGVSPVQVGFNRR